MNRDKWKTKVITKDFEKNQQIKITKDMLGVVEKQAYIPSKEYIDVLRRSDKDFNYSFECVDNACVMVNVVVSIFNKHYGEPFPVLKFNSAVGYDTNPNNGGAPSSRVNVAVKQGVVKIVATRLGFGYDFIMKNDGVVEPIKEDTNEFKQTWRDGQPINSQQVLDIKRVAQEKCVSIIEMLNTFEQFKKLTSLEQLSASQGILVWDAIKKAKGKCEVKEKK